MYFDVTYEYANYWHILHNISNNDSRLSDKTASEAIRLDMVNKKNSIKFKMRWCTKAKQNNIVNVSDENVLQDVYHNDWKHDYNAINFNWCNYKKQSSS